MIDRREIKKYILESGSDNLNVFGGLFEGGLNLQQVPNEITDIIVYLLETGVKYKNFIEVGCASGGNVKIFNKYFNFDNITIIDDNKHPKHYLRKDILSGIKYNEYIGDSQSEESEEYIKNLNITYDIMIIDADHSYQGVKKDADNYVKFLNKDGVLILHDTIACSGVEILFYEIKYNNLYGLTFLTEFVDLEHRRPCGIGVFKK